jgi:hypothetical protein
MFRSLSVLRAAITTGMEEAGRNKEMKNSEKELKREMGR